jgi:predicted dehydrogenase
MSMIRVAIVGTSFGRTVQVAAFGRHPGFEIVAIAGSDAEKAARVAEASGIPNAYGDWRRMLEETGPDLVSVVTPVDLHHPMTMAALAGGAHVLCEKPTALHRFQAAEMRDEARRRDRVLGINHEFRFFPARMHAVDLVRRGAIGRPRRGEILGRYALWALPSSRGPSWLSERRRGGGILGALGSHHTDCLRTFFGEPRAVFASVRVDQPRRGPTAERPETAIATADDGCTLHYTFEDGATAIVDLAATTPYRWERFEIHGEEASLRWDETGYALWRIAAGREPEPIEIPAALALERRDGDPALVAPFCELVRRLHAAIREGAPLAPNFDDAVAVQSALDAARLSGEAGRVVTIDVPPPADAAGDGAHDATPAGHAPNAAGLDPSAPARL